MPSLVYWRDRYFLANWSEEYGYCLSIPATPPVGEGFTSYPPRRPLVHQGDHPDSEFDPQTRIWYEAIGDMWFNCRESLAAFEGAVKFSRLLMNGVEVSPGRWAFSHGEGTVIRVGVTPGSLPSFKQFEAKLHKSVETGRHRPSSSEYQNEWWRFREAMIGEGWSFSDDPRITEQFGYGDIAIAKLRLETGW